MICTFGRFAGGYHYCYHYHCCCTYINYFVVSRVCRFTFYWNDRIGLYLLHMNYIKGDRLSGVNGAASLPFASFGAANFT